MTATSHNRKGEQKPYIAVTVVFRSKKKNTWPAHLSKLKKREQVPPDDVASRRLNIHLKDTLY